MKHKLTDEQIAAAQSRKRIVLIEGERQSGKTYCMVPWMLNQLLERGKGTYLMAGYNYCQTRRLQDDLAYFLEDGGIRFKAYADKISLEGVNIHFTPIVAKHFGVGFKAIAAMADSDQIADYNSAVGSLIRQNCPILLESCSDALGERFFGFPKSECDYFSFRGLK